MRQTALVCDGSVSADQKDAAEKVKKLAKQGILADVNPKSVQMEIECKI